jgi:hypothetical protein
LYSFVYKLQLEGEKKKNRERYYRIIKKEKRGIVGELIFRIVILEIILLGCIIVFHNKYRMHQRFDKRKFLNSSMVGFIVCSIIFISVMTINYNKYKEITETLQDVFETEDVNRVFSKQKLNTYNVNGKIYEVFPEKIIGRKTGYIISGRKVIIITDR